MWVVTWVAPKCNLAVLLILSPGLWSPTPNLWLWALSCPTHLSCKSIISFRVSECAPMMAPKTFGKTHIPCTYGTIRFLSLLCPTGILVSLSFYGLHHNPKVWPNPEVRWTWEEEMGCFLDTKPFLCSLSGILIPRGFMWGVWPQVSWPRCSLCRCLTQPGLHQVLLDTAMPSCPSQEDPGEASVLGEASVTGCYPTCMTVYLHMRSMKFCPCMLMCWGGGVGLHEQDLKGPLQWHWLPTVHKDWPRFHVSGQSKESRLSSL